MGPAAPRKTWHFKGTCILPVKQWTSLIPSLRSTCQTRLIAGGSGVTHRSSAGCHYRYCSRLLIMMLMWLTDSWDADDRRDRTEKVRGGSFWWAGGHTSTQVGRFLPTRRYTSTVLALCLCLSVTNQCSIKMDGLIELVFGLRAVYLCLYTLFRPLYDAIWYEMLF